MKKMVFLILATVTVTACSPMQKSDTTEAAASKEVSELSAAVIAGEPMRCTMSNPNENIEATYRVRGNQIHISGMIPNDELGDAHMLLTDNVMYSWSSQQETGLKFAVPEEQMEKIRKEQDMPDFKTEEDREAFRNKGYSIDCEPANLTDADFTPPANINFMDMSSYMEQAIKNGQ